MKALTIVPFACLALAACNQQPTVSLTNATPEEVAKASAANGGGVQFNPGKWESKIEFISMDIPGMPPEFAEKMKEKMAAARTVTSCMSPDEAKKPGANAFTGENRNNCTFSNYTMGGGKIDMTMVCKEAGGEMTMHITGTFAAENFTVDQEMTGSGPRGPMHTKSRISAHRVGDCDAKAAE